MLQLTKRRTIFYELYLTQISSCSIRADALEGTFNFDADPTVLAGIGGAFEVYFTVSARKSLGACAIVVTN